MSERVTSIENGRRKRACSMNLITVEQGWTVSFGQLNTFSLTPALSRWERGNPTPSRLKSARMGWRERFRGSRRELLSVRRNLTLNWRGQAGRGLPTPGEGTRPTTRRSRRNDVGLGVQKAILFLLGDFPAPNRSTLAESDWSFRCSAGYRPRLFRLRPCRTSRVVTSGQNGRNRIAIHLASRLTRLTDLILLTF